MSESTEGISVSMTPPWSPSQDVDDEELLMMEMEDDDFEMDPTDNSHSFETDSGHDPPVCFQCPGKGFEQSKQSSSRKSYLASGQLQTILNSGLQEWPSFTVDLFGETLVAMEELQYNTETLFCLCKKEMDLLLVHDGQTRLDTELLNARLNCRKFWDYVKQFILFWLPEDFYERQDFLESLTLNIKDILFHTGRLSDLPEKVVSSALLSGHSNSQKHHHFHLILDVYWSLIEVLHLLSASQNDLPLHLFDADHVLESNMSADPFSHLIHFILWDMVSFSMVQHTKLQVYEVNRNTPFLCGCIEEFLIMLIHLLEHRQSRLARPSFWVSVNPILRIVLNSQEDQAATKLTVIDSDVFPVTPKYNCNDPLGFTWWMLLHFANLYQFNIHGVHVSDTSDLPDNYYMVQMLLTKTLQDQKQSEVVLQSRLTSLLHLSTVWQPNISVITTLTEYFLKKINEHFALPTTSIMRFASAPKSPRDLLNQCLPDKVAERPLERDSSFQLFLRILVKHLGARGQHGGEWNKVKGRFYLKFSKKRVLELNETGLYNFISLFLTLAASTDLEDVSVKLYELLSAMEMSGVEMGRRLFVWKGMFALILLLVEREKDIKQLAEYMEKSLQNVASRINHGDKSLYTDLWRLVNLYIESTQEVIECSPLLSLNEHGLIGPAFQDLIKSSRENDMKILLKFIQAVITKHRATHKRLKMKSNTSSLQSVLNLSDNMWVNLFGFVKDHAKTGTPPISLADVAASFTLLSIDAPPPGGNTLIKENFTQILQHFGWGEQVNANISCRYLGLIMHTALKNTHGKPEDSTMQLNLIQAWFRCTLLVLPTNEQMTILTRQILKLDYMKSLNEFGLKEDEPLETAILSFIKALGKKYEQLQGLQEKLEFQKTVKLLLGDVAKHISPILRNWSPGDQLGILCNIIGHLVKYCAGFLYIRSKPDCLLPVLIERLVLPRFLLTSRSLPPNFLPAMKDNLYLFLQGLSLLDYNRDQYVQRKIRDIVLQYLPRFPMKTTESGVNPIVACLSESCRQNPTPSSINFRHNVIGILVSEYLKISGTATHANASLTLNIISEVFNETRSVEVKAEDSSQLLEVVLKCQLFSENPVLKQHALTIMQHLLEALPNKEELTVASSKVLRDFIVTNIALYESKVFKVLEPVGVLHPELLSTLIPVLTKAVKDSEKKREVTVDKNLRFALIQLVAPLGEKGEEIKSQLLQDAVNANV